jgi:protoheme IX farnesyltransferase
MREDLMGAERLFVLAGLCKMRISLFAAFSAVTGYLCSPHHHVASIAILFGGIIFLAAGSSALNQYQEQDIDARMPRTAQRPIPSGSVDARQALSFSLLMIAAGLLILAEGISLIAALLGLATVFWYNGVYTYLKQKSVWAVVPGALTGIMPPVIGWVVGGGFLTDPLLLYLSIFFFLWQIAHSLLIVNEYGKESEAAGLPSLTTIFTSRQLTRITSNWVFAVAIACLLLPLFIFPSPQICVWIVLPFAAFLWLTYSAIQLLQGDVPVYTVLLSRLRGALVIILIALATQESLKGILSGLMRI